MREPMLDANHESIFRNCMFVSVSVMPFALRISPSAASRRASCVSNGISKGSFRNGLCQLSTYAFSGAITTLLRFASAEAFAIETACAAHAATPSRVIRSVDANPHAPFASTRTPMPIDSLCASVPTCPFFVVKSRCRKCITRTSPYDAPRVFAVSIALVQRSHISVGKGLTKNFGAFDSRPNAPRTYHESKKTLLCRNLTSLLATTRGSALAQVSAYPSDAPSTPVSGAQFLYPDAREPRRPAASRSWSLPADTPPRAPGSQSSYPSPRRDALPPSPDSPAALRRSNKSCARPSTDTHPPAAALRASRSTISPA